MQKRCRAWIVRSSASAGMSSALPSSEIQPTKKRRQSATWVPSPKLMRRSMIWILAKMPKRAICNRSATQSGAPLRSRFRPKKPPGLRARKASSPGRIWITRSTSSALGFAPEHRGALALERRQKVQGRGARR